MVAWSLHFCDLELINLLEAALKSLNVRILHSHAGTRNLQENVFHTQDPLGQAYFCEVWHVRTCLHLCLCLVLLGTSALVMKDPGFGFGCIARNWLTQNHSDREVIQYPLYHIQEDHHMHLSLPRLSHPI